jgi:hypothetical protein
VGEWPPPKVTIDTVEQMEAAITKAKGGDHRPRLLTRISHKMAVMLDRLPDEKVQDFVDALHDAVTSKENSDTVKIRAFSAMAKMLGDGLKAVAQADKDQAGAMAEFGIGPHAIILDPDDPDVVAKLEAQLAVFKRMEPVVDVTVSEGGTALLPGDNGDAGGVDG